MTAMDSNEDFDEAVVRPAELDPEADVPGVSRRTMEICISGVLVVLGAMVLVDSYGIGAGWSEGLGPESGYFPSRVGWIFLALSVLVLVQAIRRPSDEVFVTVPQLLQVVRVLVPLAVYVALIAPLGIYVASALFIAGFMMIVGGSRWVTVLATAILLPLLAFWVFELQFQVPLPKGPLETALGY